jgi:hypothetical protein
MVLKMATSYPFLSFAKNRNLDYGEVVRHAQWFEKDGDDTHEPKSSLSISNRKDIEILVSTYPISERGKDLSSIA